MYVLFWMLFSILSCKATIQDEKKTLTPLSPLLKDAPYSLKETSENKFYFEIKQMLENDPHITDLIRLRKQKYTQTKPRILIVGAGPTGLMTAIDSYLAGASSVTLAEARTSYGRNTPIRIDGPKMDSSPSDFVDFITQLQTILGKTAFSYLESNHIIVKSGLNHPPFTRSMKIKELEMTLAALLTVLQERDTSNNLQVLFGVRFLKSKQNHTENDVILESNQNLDPSKRKQIIVKTDFLISAEGAKSETSTFINDKAPIVFSHEPVYAMIAIFSNSNQIIPISTWTDSTQNTQYKETSDLLDPLYTKTFSALETNFHWDPFKIRGLSINMLPRTRLFVLRDVLYYGVELTQDQYNHFGQNRNQLEQLAKARGALPLSSTADQLVALPGTIDIAAFSIELKKKEKVFYPIKGTHILGFLLGDALAQTHFFTGSGLNRGFEDGLHMGEMLDAWENSNTYNYQEIFTNGTSHDPLLIDFDKKVTLSVATMFLKCNGSYNIPPDGTGKKGFIQLDKSVFETHFSSILPMLQAKSNYNSANWAN